MLHGRVLPGHIKFDLSLIQQNILIFNSDYPDEKYS